MTHELLLYLLNQYLLINLMFNASNGKCSNCFYLSGEGRSLCINGCLLNPSAVAVGLLPPFGSGHYLAVITSHEQGKFFGPIFHRGLQLKTPRYPPGLLGDPKYNWVHCPEKNKAMSGKHSPKMLITWRWSAFMLFFAFIHRIDLKP